MKNKNILWLFIALIFSGLLTFSIKNSSKKYIPIEGYRVYLEGKSIGFIKSKDELNNYINVQQEKLKDKYKVDTIYIPNNIDVIKEITYDNKVDSVTSIYNKINEISPFTIKGYQVVITKKNDNEKSDEQQDDPEEDVNTKNNIVKINILNKELFTKSVENVLLSFVDEKQYRAFVNEETIELQTTGELIENIYIEDEIIIKETNIPVNEIIFTDEETLTKYLVFGDNPKEEEYVVGKDDSLERIADKSSMSINELLIANSDLRSANSLIYIGQKLLVGRVSPVFTTVIEKHVVEDQRVKYKTITQYDNTMYQGQSKTKQEGREGKTRVTQKIKIVNGEITQAYIVSSEELIPAVNKIVVKGGKQAKRGDGAWSWPTNFPYIISSRVGWRWGKPHRGIDICGTGRGSPIYAARDGEVVQITYQSAGLGYMVTIKHDNGYYTQYGHMQNVKGNDKKGLEGSATKYIKVGDRVRAHQVIGEMGSSGSSTGVHLHFEIWDGPPYQATYFNPLLFY